MVLNKWLVLIDLFSFVAVLSERKFPKDNTVEIICSQYGFITERHTITTEDDYIITIFRIINKESSKENKEPVLFMHGLFSSAENFVTSRNDSLAFLLANENYDVWLGNNRGNFYGRRHKWLNPDKDKQFWYYTFDQIGKYDIPAMIDHILKITGKRKLSYVGYSQGATAFYVMAAEVPKYNKKVRIHIAMAPAVYMKHNRHLLLKAASTFYHILRTTLPLFGILELKPIFANKYIHIVGEWLCGKHEFTIKTCSAFFTVFGGSPDPLLNYELIPPVIDTTPAGASIHQVIHFLQHIQSGTFSKYDWGPVTNLATYKSIKPPKYDLSLVTVPTFYLWSSNDVMVNSKDQKLTAKRTPNVIEFYRVPHDKFTHLNFLWADNVKPLVYDKILNVLNTFKD